MQGNVKISTRKLKVEENSMQTVALRIPAGADLRAALAELPVRHGVGAAFVLQGSAAWQSRRSAMPDATHVSICGATWRS
jgi:hypothetical protein